MDGGTQTEEVAGFRGTRAGGVRGGHKAVQGHVTALLHKDVGGIGAVAADNLVGDVLHGDLLVAVGAVQVYHSQGGAGGDVLIIIVDADQVIVLTIDQAFLLIYAIDSLGQRQIFWFLGSLGDIDLFIELAISGIVVAGGNAHGVDVLFCGAGVDAQIGIDVLRQDCALCHRAFNDFRGGVGEGLRHGSRVAGIVRIGGKGDADTGGLGREGVVQGIGVLADGFRHRLSVHHQRGNLILIVCHDGEDNVVGTVQHSTGQGIVPVGLHVAVFTGFSGEGDAAVSCVGDEVAGGVGRGIDFRRRAGFSIESAGRTEQCLGVDGCDAGRDGPAADRIVVIDHTGTQSFNSIRKENVDVLVFVVGRDILGAVPNGGNFISTQSGRNHHHIAGRFLAKAPQNCGDTLGRGVLSLSHGRFPGAGHGSHAGIAAAHIVGDADLIDPVPLCLPALRHIDAGHHVAGCSGNGRKCAQHAQTQQQCQ